MFDTMLDKLIGRMFGALLLISGCLLLALLAMLPFVMWDDAHTHTFSLKKGEWACTQLRRETTGAVSSTVSIVQTGNVVAPAMTMSIVPVETGVCEQWTAVRR